MLTKRLAADRGHANHGWLDSHHSFSFAGYYDPAHMGWGNLRVLNDDRIAAGSGFGSHSHRDMEIISYVLAGALAHEDSLGTHSIIPAGDVQRMSAGTGVVHSEFNAADAETHFLQIWLYPQQQSMAPGYQQMTISHADKRGKLCVIAAPPGQPQGLTVHADATLYAGLFDTGESATLALNPQRKAYVFLARGQLDVNTETLQAGDALLVKDEARLDFHRGIGAEVLVFDLGE